MKKLSKWHKILLGLMPLINYLFCPGTLGQEVVWEKRIALKKDDQIFCMTQDKDGSIYLGGRTARGGFQFFAEFYYRTMVIKLSPDGDSIYTKDLGDFGTVYSMTCDPFNNIRINTQHQYLDPIGYPPILLQMTPEGIIFKRDTVFYQGSEPYPTHCILASDSSIIITGNKRTNNRNGMFFQRVNPDYSLGEFKVFQPGDKSTEGNNIEELPNGRIMISGPFSNRLGSVEVDKDGSNDSSWVWQSDSAVNYYQNVAFVGQSKEKGFLGRVDGDFRWYDSLRTTQYIVDPLYGVRVATTHTDGSMVYNETNSGTVSKLIKRNADTTVAWAVDLAAINSHGSAYQKVFNSVIYNQDQSAIFGGFFSYNDTAYKSDPFLVKIANVGTPVTSLVKPKTGILKNESLAPWPNPTSRLVYLKQHFNKAEVHMYNLAGRELGVYQLRFAVPIDISGYESGIYLYRAIIDGKSYSGKIVKR